MGPNRVYCNHALKIILEFLVRILRQNPVIVQETLKILRLLFTFVKCYQLLVAKEKMFHRLGTVGFCFGSCRFIAGE